MSASQLVTVRTDPQRFWIETIADGYFGLAGCTTIVAGTVTDGERNLTHGNAGHCPLG